MSESPVTVREVERKLRVHGKFRLPDFSPESSGVARIEQQEVRHLHAVYYDIEDLRLFRWGVTLRRREGGEDAGWHLKLPVAGGDGTTRDEVRMPLSAGEKGQVPESLANIVLPLTRSGRLTAIVELRTERKPFALIDSLGTEFAELTDDLVSVMDDEALVMRFREIEVEEQVAGADLTPVVEALIAAGAEPVQESKAAAALGPVTHEPPDVLEAEPVTPDQPAGDLIVSLLRRYARAFIQHDIGVRRDLPDAVHQMRVSARRLRSALKAFGPLVDPEWADKLRAELGWAAGELGLARDTEVLLERLDRDADNLGGDDAKVVRAVIDPRLRTRLDEAREHAIASLSTRRHVELLDLLVEAARQPMLTPKSTKPARRVFPRLVERAYRRLADRVERLELSGPAQDWHEARIAAKRARYSAEAVVSVFGGPARELSRALEQVTELLGEHQDACVAQDVLREMAQVDSVDGRTGFALGLLHEHEFEEELHARLEFQRVWPQVEEVHDRLTLV
ncbi:MAG: CYTH and CHAD domain-containing protein [Candidatus Nanopelagicales bacterium]|nr:CYTH and CHAD domain-containing protein [Candidatus Nanopelagicales bacterium]